MAVDGEFHTVVPHGTDVAGDTGETTCSMQGHWIKQVVRILQINIGYHIQFAVPKAQVEAEVILVGSFPCQFVVSHAGDSHTAIIAVVNAAGH